MSVEEVNHMARNFAKENATEIIDNSKEEREELAHVNDIETSILSALT